MPGVKAGELCPGHTDTVVVLGIGSRSLFRTDHPSSGGKHPPGSSTGSPMAGVGQVGAQGSGQERESRP